MQPKWNTFLKYPFIFTFLTSTQPHFSPYHKTGLTLQILLHMCSAHPTLLQTYSNLDVFFTLFSNIFLLPIQDTYLKALYQPLCWVAASTTTAYNIQLFCKLLQVYLTLYNHDDGDDDFLFVNLDFWIKSYIKTETVSLISFPCPFYILYSQLHRDSLYTQMV